MVGRFDWVRRLGALLREAGRLSNHSRFTMWTRAIRQQHSLTITRYQTDLTDTEWHVIVPHLPMHCATARPREWPTREIFNAIFYVMRANCPWACCRTTSAWGTISAGSPSGAMRGALNG